MGNATDDFIGSGSTISEEDDDSFSGSTAKGISNVFNSTTAVELSTFSTVFFCSFCSDGEGDGRGMLLKGIDGLAGRILILEMLSVSNLAAAAAAAAAAVITAVLPVVVVLFCS